jgi:RNA polymerase sigma-70 factor, ECF subfamily
MTKPTLPEPSASAADVFAKQAADKVALADSFSALLARAKDGDRAALDQLMPVVYQELRGIAARLLSGERAHHTLQATALINEAYLRLRGSPNSVQGLNDRAHFFALSARVMRNVLVDHANARNAQKRGSGIEAYTLSFAENVSVESDKSATDLLALHEALERFAKVDERSAQVLEMITFGGMELQAVADALGISLATVKRDWLFARTWLKRELAD